MPQSGNAKGLPGGRALYTGQNSYASQGFENDTRKMQLPGLAYAYLAADRLNTTQDASALVWGASTSSIGTKNVFLRGFALLADGATLQCQIPGAYKLSGSVRLVLASAAVAIARIQVTRAGILIYDSASVSTNTGSISGQFTVGCVPMIVDLKAGDRVYLIVTSPAAGTATLGATGSTGILLEQIDIPL